MLKVAPSILACDIKKLLEEVKTVENATFLHIDVMDGHFVPNISLGPCVYNNLKGKVNMIFDVHLMISHPEKYYQEFIKSGADYLTLHLEALQDNNTNIIELINAIHQLGCKVGLAIKSNTDVSLLNDYLPYIDLALAMSVEPGFGGQKFMANVLSKVTYLKEQKLDNYYKYLIEIDGGINDMTAKLAKNAGCDVVVAGTYIFNSSNRQLKIKELENL